MQYIPIKTIIKDGKEYYRVAAIPLKNKNKSIVQKIPHPLGTDFVEYDDIEHAKEAVLRSGFSYILPDGTKILSPAEPNTKKSKDANIELKIFEAIKDKINSTNSNVAASAVLAISEFPTEETFNILFEKIGEENESIRKNAILGICKYGNMLSDEIITALSSPNWIKRNSAISCIQSLIGDDKTDITKFITPLIDLCSDQNPIVQASALSTLSGLYKEYKNKDLANNKKRK